jgi:hypothetical protein
MRSQIERRIILAVPGTVKFETDRSIREQLHVHELNGDGIFIGPRRHYSRKMLAA